MKKFILVTAVMFGGLSQTAISGEGHDHDKEKKWHCEKTVDGKTEDLKEVKSRKECKKSGGKWKKAHKKDHKEGDGHDHG